MPPSIRRFRLAKLAVAALPAAAFAAAAPSAGAVTLECGQTITKDTTLTADVSNCPGVGIRIGADDITLDLNGHTVSAAERRNPTAHGIFNSGHDDVSIVGGTVRGFGAYGVRLARADRNVVQDMTLDANFTGIGLVESDRGLIRRLTITGAKFVGVNLTGGSSNRVRENQITGGNGAGIFIQNSQNEPGRDHRITSNQLDGNGIVVQAGPTGVRLTSNTVRRALSDGIASYDPSTIFLGNVATENHGRGIYTPNGWIDRGGNQEPGNGLQ
jgi:parallel beta-helix repeat protein